MKTKINVIGIVLSLLLLIACNNKADIVIENQESDRVESIIVDEQVIEENGSLQGFIQGEAKAYREDSENGFYIQNLPMAEGEDDLDYFHYRIGEFVDLDNDGEDELILDGPYGGMFLDCVDGNVVVFAEGQGTARCLLYVYYENAYWIVYADEQHAGRQIYDFFKYDGSQKIVDSFRFSAEYYNTTYEEGDFTFRDKAITMDQFEELWFSFFGRRVLIQLPDSYKEIVYRCEEIINEVEENHINYPEEEEGLMGFTYSVLYSGTNKEDFCFSYVDLNDDGIKEFVLANRCHDAGEETANYKAGYTLINIFTLVGDEAIPVVEAHSHSKWYINENKEMINTCWANPGWYEITVYTYDNNEAMLREKYCLYNAYLDNNQDVGQFERLNGGKEFLIEQYDDFNKNELWDYYKDVFNQYTQNPYKLDLIPICGN